MYKNGLLAFCVVLAFTACSPTKDEPPNKTETDQKAEIIVQDAKKTEDIPKINIPIEAMNKNILPVRASLKEFTLGQEISTDKCPANTKLVLGSKNVFFGLKAIVCRHLDNTYGGEEVDSIIITIIQNKILSFAVNLKNTNNIANSNIIKSHIESALIEKYGSFNKKASNAGRTVWALGVNSEVLPDFNEDLIVLTNKDVSITDVVAYESYKNSNSKKNAKDL
jgi:hypothetical protein